MNKWLRLKVEGRVGTSEPDIPRGFPGFLACLDLRLHEVEVGPRLQDAGMHDGAVCAARVGRQIQFFLMSAFGRRSRICLAQGWQGNSGQSRTRMQKKCPPLHLRSNNLSLIRLILNWKQDRSMCFKMHRSNLVLFPPIISVLRRHSHSQKVNLLFWCERESKFRAVIGLPIKDSRPNYTATCQDGPVISFDALPTRWKPRDDVDLTLGVIVDAEHNARDL